MYKLYENPYFKDIYKALKLAKKDLDYAIDSQKMILFETMPPDYKFEFAKNQDPEFQAQKNWKLIQGLAMTKNTGIKEIDKIITDKFEKEMFHELLEASFAKGQKPPQKLTEVERRQIASLYNIVSARAKKGIVKAG